MTRDDARLWAWLALRASERDPTARRVPQPHVVGDRHPGQRARYKRRARRHNTKPSRASRDAAPKIA